MFFKTISKSFDNLFNNSSLFRLVCRLHQNEIANDIYGTAAIWNVRSYNNRAAPCFMVLNNYSSLNLTKLPNISMYLYVLLKHKAIHFNIELQSVEHSKSSQKDTLYTAESTINVKCGKHCRNANVYWNLLLPKMHRFSHLNYLLINEITINSTKPVLQMWILYVGLCNKCLKATYMNDSARDMVRVYWLSSKDVPIFKRHMIICGLC